MIYYDTLTLSNFFKNFCFKNFYFIKYFGVPQDHRKNINLFKKSKKKLIFMVYIFIKI